MKRLSLLERRSYESINCSPKPAIPQRIELIADALAAIEESEEGMNEPLGVVLPIEKIAFQSFCEHYEEFLITLNQEVTDSFMLKTDEKIALYAIYCANWGQKK